MAASSTNPFRTHLVNPQGTGLSDQSATMHGSTDSKFMTAMGEDAPPAYTPTPDSNQGEAAMEFGPQRPFQHAPPPALSPFLAPQSQMPADPRRQPSVASTFSTNTRHPSLTPSWPHSAPSFPDSPAQPYNFPTGLPSSQQSFSPPPGPLPTGLPSSQQSFSPPPGPLPTGLPSSQQSFSPPPGPPPQSFKPPPGLPPSSADLKGTRSAIPDDSRPTTTPMPGHPLLNQGRLLMYPPGFECPKCHNIGYKNNDPSHPCKKCWERYGRSYTPALAYAPSHPSGDRNNFQRPLPVFSPPQSFQSRHLESSTAHQSFDPPPPHSIQPQHSHPSFQPHQPYPPYSSFQSPQAYPSFQPPNAQPTFYPPHAQPAFQPPHAQPAYQPVPSHPIAGLLPMLHRKHSGHKHKHRRSRSHSYSPPRHHHGHSPSHHQHGHSPPHHGHLPLLHHGHSPAHHPHGHSPAHHPHGHSPAHHPHGHSPAHHPHGHSPPHHHEHSPPRHHGHSPPHHHGHSPHHHHGGHHGGHHSHH